MSIESIVRKDAIAKDEARSRWDMERDLRDRLGLHHGAMALRGWKNVNWGIVSESNASVFWFGYGDLSEDDLAKIKSNLHEDEVFVAGWKDQRPPRMFSEALGLGTRPGRGDSIYITITHEGVRTDRPANTIF